MGYEAQIAGIGTNDPYMGFKNYAVKVMRNLSIIELAKRRKECVEYANKKGFILPLINGGGTGSIESTLEENYITEVTVGSGFYSPGLFDYYENFKHQPAVGFACEIVRNPKKNMFTAMGGGYIASGGIGFSKQPTPFLPKGFTLIQNEGCGEVQTPINYNGKEKLTLGDTILFRHAKAGELCERFNELQIVSHGKIVGKTLTFRGEGKCFV
jgi:D-serine deaminase-like pyridoxal phosphate-dependent protein